MIKLNVYSETGIKKASINMPKSLIEKENKLLLAQAIRVYESGMHPGVSRVKTRGEIRASKRKIYRQKGTGQARHGALSAPIFVGGGKAHGPKGVKRTLSLPKKMRQKSLKVALSIKGNDKRLIVVDNISSLKKTKDAADLINKIVKNEKEIGDKSKFTFALSEKNEDAKKALRNIENVNVVLFKNLNAYKVYFGGALVVDKQALEEMKKEGNKEKTKEKAGSKGKDLRKSAKN
jgi:large subunit ribosomal protein L4